MSFNKIFIWDITWHLNEKYCNWIKYTWLVHQDFEENLMEKEKNAHFVVMCLQILS